MDTANTPSQLNLLTMAKQGNLDALATLMDRSLQTRGITTELTLSGDCLTINAICTQVIPDQSGLVGWLQSGLNSMQPKGVKRVIVRAKLVGSKSMA